MKSKNPAVPIVVALLALLIWAATAQAQLGSGWNVYTPSERLEYETNDILFTISPPPNYFNNGFCAYSNSGTARIFQLLTHSSNRIEIRPNDDYSTGTHQFQADIVMSPPTSGECLHQIFNGPTGPWCIIRQYTNFNGSLRIFAGASTSYIATNLNSRTFRLNTINDMNSGQCYFYINGRLVHQVANPGGTFYTKYGTYGTHDDAHTAYVVFNHATLYTGGNETGAGNGDFSLSAAPGSVSVNPGNNVSTTITETDLNGYAGTVDLSVSGLPSGVTASFNPNPTTGTSTLTFTASSTAATGTATVTITGTDATIVGDTLTHSTTVSLTVNPPGDFSLSASPASLTVVQGNSGTSTITETDLNGFSGSVSLSASGLPSGVTASFSPNPTTSTSTLTLTASGTAATGTATVTITGTSGSLQHTTTVSLTVNPAPDFSLSASPTSLTVVQGNNGTSTITVNPLNGFSGSVSLSASGLPSGVTASFSPNPTTSTSTLTLTASGTAATGTATVTITGTSGSLQHTTTVSLTVNPAPDFSLSASPTSLTVVQGNNGTSTITVNPLNGFSGSVSLSASGLPSGVTASFSPNPTTSTSTLTLTASGTAATGTATVTITGTSGALTHTTTISLTVNPSTSLPAGWTDADIGAVGLAGSASYNNGTFTVSGSGADIWTAADQFNYVYQSVSNDMTIIARVVSESGTASYAKAGVMIRETLATNSVEASVLVTPTNGVAMEVRSTTGAASINVAGWVRSISPPQWVKLVRSGSTFTSYYSADGSTWTQLTSTNVTMNSSATAGLAVSSHDNTSLSTATFDNVNIIEGSVIDTTQIYKLQNEASGLVLNNQGSLTNGSAVTQWTATTVSSNLDWTFIATSNGYYQINSCKSGLDAVVQSASTANGAGIVQWSFGSAGNDQWKPFANSDGSYTFYNLHSGLVLEDPGSSTNKTTQMDQWSANGGSNQKWMLLPQ
jgi:hypothetical protein